MSVPEWLNLTTDQIAQKLPHTPYASDPVPFGQSQIGLRVVRQRPGVTIFAQDMASGTAGSGLNLEEALTDLRCNMAG